MGRVRPARLRLSRQSTTWDTVVGGESARRPRIERSPAFTGRWSGSIRGTSGLHRARCWVTPSRGDSQDSATENRPPMAMRSSERVAQARVKRCGKSAPAPGVTRVARQTPSGARSDRGRAARPQTPPGRPLESAGNRRPRGMAATGPHLRVGGPDRIRRTGRLTTTYCPIGGSDPPFQAATPCGSCHRCSPFAVLA